MRQLIKLVAWIGAALISSILGLMLGLGLCILLDSMHIL